MWFVIKPFTDMKDKDHSCNEGDPFPKEVSEERTKKLSSKNSQETPLDKERSSEPKVSKKRGRPKKKE